MVLNLQIGISQQLIPQHLRQPRLHLPFNQQIPKILLQKLMFQVIPHLILHILPDLKIVHV